MSLSRKIKGNNILDKIMLDTLNVIKLSLNNGTIWSHENVLQATIM